MVVITRSKKSINDAITITLELIWKEIDSRGLPKLKQFSTAKTTNAYRDK